MRHAGIQYSPIPSLNPIKPLSSLSGQEIPGDPDSSSVLPGPAKFKHSFVQAGSQDLLSLPPQLQMGWPYASGNKPIIKQPVARPGAFFPYQSPANPMNDTRNDAMIQFLLHYDVTQSKLKVHLQHVSNLPREYDRIGRLMRCDPYVTLQLEPDKSDTLKSQVVEHTYDPEFDESFLFGGFSLNDIKYQALVFRIYNDASKSKAMIGEASLSLADVELFGVVVQMPIHTEEIKVCEPISLILFM